MLARAIRGLTSEYRALNAEIVRKARSRVTIQVRVDTSSLDRVLSRSLDRRQMPQTEKALKKNLG